MPENRPENLRFQRWGFLYALKWEGGGAIAENEQKEERGMGVLPQRSKPYHLQRTLPQVRERLQAEFPGGGRVMPKLQIQTKKGAETT